MKIKLSTIIPIYNKENALRQTLQSIVDNHEIDDGLYECILVDDESTDSSPAICKEFCDKYSYFKYIRIFNDGFHTPSNASNYGLDICKGEYIHILGADDTICKTFYKDGTRILDETMKDVFIRGYYERDNIYDYICPFRPYLHDLHGQPICASIFRNYIKDIKFEPVLSQDVIFTWIAVHGHEYYDDRDNCNSFVYHREFSEVNKQPTALPFPQNVVQILQKYDSYKFKLNEKNEIVDKNSNQIVTLDTINLKK